MEGALSGAFDGLLMADLQQIWLYRIAGGHNKLGYSLSGPLLFRKKRLGAPLAAVLYAFSPVSAQISPEDGPFGGF